MGHISGVPARTRMSNSLYPATTKPTRITEFSATIIDNIFCNIPANSLTGIMYKNISDHLPIFVMHDMRVKKMKELRPIETRDLSDENIAKFQEKIENVDWSGIIKIDDVNGAYGNFMSIFKKHFDDCCPQCPVAVQLELD